MYHLNVSGSDKLSTELKTFDRHCGHGQEIVQFSIPIWESLETERCGSSHLPNNTSSQEARGGSPLLSGLTRIWAHLA